MEVFPLFPMPVYLSDEYAATPAETTALKIQDWVVNPDGNKFSANNHVLDLPVLIGLRSFLQTQVENFVHEILGVTRQSRFFITQSWVTVKTRGSAHHIHAHPNSLVSGVYYLDGELAPIAFKRPAGNEIFGSITLTMEKVTPFSAMDCSLPNRKNHAILFPSTMQHFVRENPSDAPRYSVAFNSFAKGLLGNPAELTGLSL